MRLTLRTLLSWKDGMLAEEAARDLAGRVAATAAAKELVERIDQVVARPTLSTAAPDATGFAAAANSTAEYLDNVLAADRLTEFERVCFASDAQLAETAATHEILATWSREPGAPLDAAARRALLGAVRARLAEGKRPMGGIARVAPEPLRTATAAAVPDATRRRAARAPATAWLLVVAALVLLAALVGVLGWSLAGRGRKTAGAAAVAARGGAANEPAAGVVEPLATVSAALDEPPPPEAPRVAAADAPHAGDAAASAAPGAVAEVPSPTATASPSLSPAGAPDADFPPREEGAEPPADGEARVGELTAAVSAPVSTDAAAVPGTRVEQRVPQGDALAIAAPAPSAPPAGVRPVTVPAPPAAPPGAAAAVGGTAVLLHRPAGGAADAWTAGAPGASLELPADIVTSPFGRPTVSVDGLQIVCEPVTRAVLGRDADGVPRLEVIFGAAAVVGDGRIGVTAGGIAGTVTAGRAAPVGVQVSLARRPGEGAESTQRVARIVPVAGRIEWRPAAAAGGAAGEPRVGGEGPDAIAVGQALTWRSETPDSAAIEPVPTLPAWLSGRRADDRIDALAAEALTHRLGAGTAAVPALRDLAADRRIERRLAAAATLALVGEFAELARLLTAEGVTAPREAQWERLDAAAVQPALARGPKAADAFARALVEHGPPGAAEVVARFARGFTDEELANGGAAELVAALESPHLVVRRYAIKNLVAITGAGATDRLRYRADRSAEELHEGAAWWRARLEQGRVRRGDAAVDADR